MALAASMFMAAYGKQGLPALARLNFDKAHYALRAIMKEASSAGVRAGFGGGFFNEFVVRGLDNAAGVRDRLARGQARRRDPARRGLPGAERRAAGVRDGTQRGGGDRPPRGRAGAAASRS